MISELLLLNSYRNFVPGSFLDSYGNDVVQPPPPVKDVLADFLSRVETKKSKFWTILTIFLFAIGSQVVTVIMYTVSHFILHTFSRNYLLFRFLVDVCIGYPAA